MLAPAGTRVSGVSGLYRCSALHRLAHLDAATVDLQMPSMGGTELCQWLLVRYPHVRAILKSGNLAGDDNARARWLGAPEFVHKPFTVESVMYALPKSGIGSGDFLLANEQSDGRF
ncbi:MAG: CheY-like chemotaxis protein [Gammaproteobacteria bacterium]|jgi:CheY-like chemotaxis protein